MFLKNIFKFILLVLLCLRLGNMDAVAQKKNTPPYLYMVGDAANGVVKLRWVPSEPVLWQLGIQYGYTLHKHLVSKNGVLVPKTSTTSGWTKKILPISPAKIMQLSGKDSLIETIGALMYPKKTDQPTSTSVLGKLDDVNRRYGITLLLADIHFPAAKAAALAFVDDAVTSGEQYLYSVELNIPADLKKELNYKMGSLYISGDELWKTPAVEKPLLEVQNNMVGLSWNMEHVNSFYTAYEIERSYDKIRFTPVSDFPFVQLAKNKSPGFASFTDSISLPNTDSIYYRVRGITPFGKKGPYSAIAAQRNFIVAAYRPYIQSGELAGIGKVKLSWNFPDSIIPNISSMQLWVSPYYNHSYVAVTEQEKTAIANQLIDTVRFVNNYYKLSITYKEPRQTFTSLPYFFQGEDSIPPVKPIMDKRSSIDSAGIATIRWKSNPDKDVQGYRLFRANNATEEMIAITPHFIKDTEYHDTLKLNALTSKVYYSVVAADDYFNLSDYSDTLVLRRPDTIPPSPALIRIIRSTDSSIIITLIPSASSDLSHYLLYKMPIGNMNDTSMVRKIHAGDNTDLLEIIDTSFQEKIKYQYLLITVDSSNNCSKDLSGIIEVDPPVKKAVEKLSGEVNKDKNKIQIHWEYKYTGVDYFMLYRAIKEGAFSMLARIDANQFFYEDDEVQLNNSYRYKIKAVFLDGKNSQLSNPFTVLY
jgi:hypothetical protein